MTTPSDLLAPEYRHETLDFRLEVAIANIDGTGFSTTLLNRFCEKAAGAGYDMRVRLDVKRQMLVMHGQKQLFIWT